MTKLTDSKRVILISFWCDFFPDTQCSKIQKLCDYVEDNDLADELDSVKAYTMCINDFVSKCVLETLKEFGR
jgi:hypothetical protein